MRATSASYDPNHAGAPATSSASSRRRPWFPRPLRRKRRSKCREEEPCGKAEQWAPFWKSRWTAARNYISQTRRSAARGLRRNSASKRALRWKQTTAVVIPTALRQWTGENTAVSAIASPARAIAIALTPLRSTRMIPIPQYQSAHATLASTHQRPSASPTRSFKECSGVVTNVSAIAFPEGNSPPIGRVVATWSLKVP